MQISCEDAGEYRRTANNGIGSLATGDVLTVVQCDTSAAIYVAEARIDIPSRAFSFQGLIVYTSKQNS